MLGEGVLEIYSCFNFGRKQSSSDSFNFFLLIFMRTHLYGKHIYFVLKGWGYTVDWALLFLHASLKTGLFKGHFKSEIKVSGDLQARNAFYLAHQLEEGRAETAGPTLAPAWGTMKDLVFVLSRAAERRGNTSNPSMLLEPELQLALHSLAPAPANANTSAYTYLALLLEPAASSQGDPSPLLLCHWKKKEYLLQYCGN